MNNQKECLISLLHKFEKQNSKNDKITTNAVYSSEIRNKRNERNDVEDLNKNFKPEKNHENLNIKNSIVDVILFSPESKEEKDYYNYKKQEFLDHFKNHRSITLIQKIDQNNFENQKEIKEHVINTLKNLEKHSNQIKTKNFESNFNKEK